MVIGKKRRRSFWILNLFLASTLVQLLKDIDDPKEIIEYIQPYIGSVSKAREFAANFLFKRNQLANLDSEQVDDVFLDSISATTDLDDGFQLASSSNQRKKGKKTGKSAPATR